MGLLEAFVELLFDIADDIARFGNWLRKNPIAGLGALFLVVFFSWLTDRLLADSVIFTAAFWESSPEGIRNLVWAMATVFAGAAGLYGLLLAGRRTAALDRQAEIAHSHRELAEQGQITERFTKAVEQLGHKEVAVRLGAIYALERIAKDSERDFVTIMETLAAFVRERAPRPPRDSADDSNEEDLEFENVRKPEIDVSAAVSVLARSIPLGSLIRVGDITERVDLRNVDLRGLDLPGATLAGFRFDDSDMSFAILSEADLTASSFARARCIRTAFVNAKLAKANFAAASLARAYFDGIRAKSVSFAFARMECASFELVQFEETNFQSVNFSAAYFLLSDFVGCNMGDAKLHGVSLSGDMFVGCNFRNASFGTSFVSADISRVVFDGCDMSESKFGKAVFEDWIDAEAGETLICRFKDSDISGVDFESCRGLKSEHIEEAYYRVKSSAPHLPSGISLDVVKALSE